MGRASPCWQSIYLAWLQPWIPSLPSQNQAPLSSQHSRWIWQDQLRVILSYRESDASLGYTRPCLQWQLHFCCELRHSQSKAFALVHGTTCDLSLELTRCKCNRGRFPHGVWSLSLAGCTAMSHAPARREQAACSVPARSLIFSIRDLLCCDTPWRFYKPIGLCQTLKGWHCVMKVQF